MSILRKPKEEAAADVAVEDVAVEGAELDALLAAEDAPVVEELPPLTEGIAVPDPLGLAYIAE